VTKAKDASPSAINQQIALKTISKLGFKACAVWNGKEALEYVLSSQSPDASHSKPDLILMDVQMPIMDGYRATHLLRHHLPFSIAARDIPIVAMTASAIQGDREKCQKAGMDDYLAKPVKGRTLEKMLVKWAVHKRAPHTPSEPSSNGEGHGRDCDETDIGSTLDMKDSVGPLIETGESACSSYSANTKSTKRPALPSRTNSCRQNYLGTETEGNREVLRSEAEKTIGLRDGKLIVAAGGLDDLLPHAPEFEGQRLTVENVGRLEREGGGTLSHMGRNSSTSADDECSESLDAASEAPIH
jgi:CheY-like chemotaxis protein